MHWILFDYSIHISKFVLSENYDLYSKTYLKFIQGVFKFMLDVLNIKVTLTPSQFLSNNFAEVKLILTWKLIHMLKKKNEKIISSIERQSKNIKVFLVVHFYS